MDSPNGTRQEGTFEIYHRLVLCNFIRIKKGGPNDGVFIIIQDKNNIKKSLEAETAFGGRLTAIRQDGFERILFFDFEATNEMGDRVNLTLAAEIMGRRSNLILYHEDGRIIDSIKRVGQEMSSVRMVLPGAQYTLPPSSSA